MHLCVPHYYEDFACIANKCLDNCCLGGWEINIDEETVHYYKSLHSEFGKKIVEHLNYTDEYSFQLVDGHCPFLNQQNLCVIHQELGANHLGVVCTQFPRYTEYYGNIKEMGIGLACEEAARIILTDTKPFVIKCHFIDEPINKSFEYDEALGEILFHLRAFFFELFNQNNYTFHQKLIALIDIASELQNYINQNDIEQMNILSEQMTFEQICKRTNTAIHKNTTLNIEASMQQIWNVYCNLESINNNWDITVNEVMSLFHRDSNKIDYDEILTKFNLSILEHTTEYENIIKYYLFRYFMKASFDYNILGKVQLIISNYLIIRELEMAEYLKNHYSLNFKDRMNTIHIFSREVEYSETNIETLYEEFIFNDVFRPENLTNLLLVL